MPCFLTMGFNGTMTNRNDHKWEYITEIYLCDYTRVKKKIRMNEYQVIYILSTLEQIISASTMCEKNMRTQV